MNRTSSRQSSRISNGDSIDSSRKHVLLVDHSQTPAGPNLKKPRPGPLPRRSLRRPLSTRSTPDSNNSDSDNNRTNVFSRDRNYSPPTPSEQSSEKSAETTDSSSSCEKALQTTLGDQESCHQETNATFIAQERESGLCQTETFIHSANLSSGQDVQSSSAQDDRSSRQAECSSTVIIETYQIPNEISLDNRDPDCNEDQETDLQDTDIFPSVDEIEGWDDFEGDFGNVQDEVPENACPICGVDLSTLTIMVCGLLLWVICYQTDTS